MNRFQESTNRVCNLVENLHLRGRRRLRLSIRCARKLRIRLNAAAQLHSCGDGLRRLKADAAQIQRHLRMVSGQYAPVLPAGRQGVRALLLARELVDGGEMRLDEEKLVQEIAAFDRIQEMEMLELQCMPAALNIALCEALEGLLAEMLREHRLRAAAERWVRRGGRGSVTGDAPAFWAQALHLCSEEELPLLHARAVKLMERRGVRPEHAVESAHRIAADHCLRLENLQHARRLLEQLDWERCFVRISPAEQEFCADPGLIYARMDAPSKACIREYTAQLAACMKVSEIAVVRYAQRSARAAAQMHGLQDPRATLCWYLAEDGGRRELQRELGSRCRLPRCVPDSRGRCCVLLAALVTAAVLALVLWMLDEKLLAIYALPLAWETAMQLIGRIYPRHVRPAHLLKMKIEAVPEHARTLVVLPVLLSSAARVREMLEHMEALGCLEQDANIDYLLLGDFRDADSAEQSDDGAILAEARSGVARLNATGRHKYFYLHRSRSLRRADGRWMGENRKRGALMALNALLLNRKDAADAFTAEGADAPQLAGRYAYVVTLDADTEYLPGTLQQLIGAMLHPLNRACLLDGRRRGYAVLQPRMELLAEACTNGYAQLNYGCGGMDCYPVHLSDFYQDFCRRGCFAGKGIYDVRAFARATEGVLRDDAILSHDLIEGILAGAGSLGDVCFFDACPRDQRSDLMRLHRWTRGDWQLLPVLFSRMKLAAVDRMKLLGNLLRSLYAPALLGLLIHAVWMDAPLGFLLGLALAFREGLADLRARTWKRALFQLANLPARAVCMLDAVLRTLWRLAISRKHLMDWVPAAEGAGNAKQSRLSARAAVILLLPGLLRGEWIAAVAALGLLFLAGPAWADDLARTNPGEKSRLSAEQTALLEDIARRTWRFFEEYVPLPGSGLPPDNVQLDPPAGTAMRTSPTNIGLYMMSCLSAHHMGFIHQRELLLRLEDTVSTLEKLEKWNGQLYNWYDLGDLSPLRPRYVSAVDSGNLAGAMLLCAQAIKGEPLARRILALLEQMNLAALYDSGRELFCIGMDVETGRMSQAHYDLYASEARILSYAAMMLGQVNSRHWLRLSRAAVRCGRHQALLSWSGTMFEYLMPELLFSSPENTLAGQSRRGMLACQMAQGRLNGRPWGISESGYYAFDLHLNYQYRAFGLRNLALSAHAVQDVIAPYAAALALMVQPCAAAHNLQRMCDLGLLGELGLYEAADYQGVGERARIVRSHMAHHQGMALCAICNVLCGDRLRRDFMEIPQARALRILLQEKPGAWAHIRRRQELAAPEHEHIRPETSFRRRGRREDCAADTHLLRGAGTTALVTARGAVFAWKNGWQLNRFFGDLCSAHQGMFVHLNDPETQKCAVLGGEGDWLFDAGSARCSLNFEDTHAELILTVSPEDGALYQHIRLKQGGREARSLEITGCLAVALAAEKDMRAHPVFQNLFVRSCRREDALVFRRRRRESGEPWPQLVYLLAGGEVLGVETSLERLTGRTGALGLPGGIARVLEGSTGDVLDPCAAIRTCIRLKPGQQTELHFALNLLSEDELEAGIRRMRSADAPRRAMQLSGPQARAVLGHTGIDAQAFRLLQRAAALIFDPRLRTERMHGDNPCNPVRREDLWRTGVSGDLPILLVELQDLSGMDCVREVLHMHAFYRMMGVKMDFVLVDCHGSDYLQPARGALRDLIASSHLGGSISAPGGAFILEKDNLEACSLEALRRSAALYFNGAAPALAQLRIQLDGLYLRKRRELAPMAAGKLELPHEELRFFNGLGGFDQEGYVILLQGGNLPPAPWSNVIAGERSGAMVTERGGGYAWWGNSRSDRLTPFANDPLHEGWGWMFYLLDEGGGRWLRLLPGDTPMTDFRVCHAPGCSRWSAGAEDLAFEVELSAQEGGVRFDITLENRGERMRHLRLAGLVNWIMGTDAGDAALLRTWAQGGTCFAAGAAKCVGVFACDDPQARPGCDRGTLCNGGDMMNPHGLDLLQHSRGGWTLQLPLLLRAGERRTCRFLLGGAADSASAAALARDFRSGEALRRSENWQDRLEKLQILTPDAAVNLLANGFLQAQVLNARIRGRTGLYQGGGAFGFRDQLQDMLPMIHYEPERVRAHLLYCAARQFPSGDVLHWWHDPYTGVRTHISDDLLFLPYVTAGYVRITGDREVLEEEIPFLREIEIPRGSEDIYAEMQPGEETASLHSHCMRALRRAANTGRHGLCRMGSGDWNDGMNRVGAGGEGESIWLSQFLAVCAGDYAEVCAEGEERAWLLSLRERLCAAIEEHGWDGAWYLRAYTDDGARLGSHACRECRIDLISQAWSVLAHLDGARVRSAVDSAWQHLADENLELIRLLDPPFTGEELDPGYIAAYPPGVRENGAQYTHAACWMLIALARMGDAGRAHRALQMLLPVNHALTRRDAQVYRLEPYVMAADIYTHADHPGRGGWSWYTGSAAWMLLALLELLGFERRGSRVRLHALLGDWPQAGVRLHWGSSSYTLLCRSDVQQVTLDGEAIQGEFIRLADDGREHIALFPPRSSTAEM